MMVALRDALNRLVRCPDEGCGAPAYVEAGRNRAATAAGLPAPPGTATPGRPLGGAAAAWLIVRCPRTGCKLWAGHTPVELIDD